MDVEERLAADECAEAVVDRRRHDQVDLAVFVFEQHEDDPVCGRGSLSGDRHSRERDPRLVWLLFQLAA